MAFNKNHFNLIADVLNESRGLTDEANADALIDDIARVFAEKLDGTNYNFDGDRFLKQCGVKKQKDTDN